MGFTTTVVFYLLIGGSVAAATYLAGDGPGRGERAFQVITAFFFWPLYLPILLQFARRSDAPAEPATPSHAADEMDAAIAQVETEMDAAFSNLDGWAEDVIAREFERVAELRGAWRHQAGRIRELDRLLAQSESDAQQQHTATAAANERVRQSLEVHLENLARLRQLRRQMYDDLLGTLAWVRELVTMIHLAKYTGAPASRAEELVSQIAAAVEGLSEVTRWQEPAFPTAPLNAAAAGHN